jgi:hypothetical protein
MSKVIDYLVASDFVRILANHDQVIGEKFLDAGLNNYFMMTTRVRVNRHKGALTN